MPIFKGYEPLDINLPKPQMNYLNYYDSLKQYNQNQIQQAQVDEVNRRQAEEQAIRDSLKAMQDSGQDITNDSLRPELKKAFLAHGDVKNLLSLMGDEEQARKQQEVQDRNDLSTTLKIAQMDPNFAAQYMRTTGLDKKYGDGLNLDSFRKLYSQSGRPKGYVDENGNFIPVIPGYAGGGSGGNVMPQYWINKEDPTDFLPVNPKDPEAIKSAKASGYLPASVAKAQGDPALTALAGVKKTPGATVDDGDSRMRQLVKELTGGKDKEDKAKPFEQKEPISTQRDDTPRYFKRKK